MEKQVNRAEARYRANGQVADPAYVAGIQKNYEQVHARHAEVERCERIAKYYDAIDDSNYVGSRHHY